MRTELFTVSKIFTESLYRIPDYQRGYSWQLEQLKDFWLDLEQLQDDGKHYIGVLTLEEVSDRIWVKWEDDTWIIRSRRYEPYYVVDGQQRLTTVIILIQAIIEACNSSQLNFTLLSDIRRKYIFDSKPEDLARSYVFGYEKDNPSYEFLKKRIFMEDSDVHLPDEATIYTKNLLAAKSFFAEQLKELSEKELEKIYTKITQQLVFNVYEIATDIDVFVTFETMNNRGKPLSTLELLKNRLIYLSTKLPSPEGREGILRRNVNDAWKSAYHYLGKNSERQLEDDEFLRTQLSHFYFSTLRELPEKLAEGDRERELREFAGILEYAGRFLLNQLFTPKRIGSNEKEKNIPALTGEFIKQYSDHLKRTVELYFKLSTPEQSEFSDIEKIQLERIGRLRGYSPSPMLMALFLKEKKAEKRARLMEKMERYYFCISFSGRNPYYFGRRGYYAADYFVDYTAGRLNTDDAITLFENRTNELFKEMPLHEQLHDWIKNGHNYYGWRAIKYFLYEYELELQKQSRSHRDKINWSEFCRENFRDDYETIEHIYPQRARDKYWTDRFSKYSPTQKRLLRHSLGNLLPLSKPRNSSLGNKSFPEKVGGDEKKTGYRFGSYSENEVALFEEWNAEKILERGLRLLDFMEKRWKLSIGDRKQKARALGLGFLAD